MNGQDPMFVIFSAYGMFVFLPKKILHAFSKSHSCGSSCDTFQLMTDDKDLTEKQNIIVGMVMEK